ncbi:MAG: hypothetical protein SFT91_01425, partial [Rickettsiaceae bacterium]|nr:hypothetical protein [Rickettsiaceae bacterium]
HMLAPSSYAELYADFAALDNDPNIITKTGFKISAFGISNLATGVVEIALSTHSIAKKDHEIQSAILKHFGEEYKKDYGFNEIDQATALAELMNYRSIISYVASKIIEMQKILITSLTGL